MNFRRNNWVVCYRFSPRRRTESIRIEKHERNRPLSVGAKAKGTRPNDRCPFFLSPFSRRDREERERKAEKRTARRTATSSAGGRATKI